MAKSGSFRHKILIQYNQTTTNLDEFGRLVSSSTTYATVKGSLNKLTGTEKQVAEQAFGSATHEMRCWFVPGVSNNMWLECLNGKRFNIVDVEDIEEKQRELRIILNSETS